MAVLRMMARDISATKHIVFVHGLDGDAETTWQPSNQEKVFWPTWLCEHLVDVCICSVGYEALKLSVLNIGLGLMDRAQNECDILLRKFESNEGDFFD
ncbi:hypothetical protein BCU30_021700 [Vibrio lentus]|uniref:hypothetical protein n=1 Tax=Vibrio lentus TaxID=136468 RepID=UPI000C85528F|nr:hypothetical protein [Vibrio lentus]PMJ11370.1 hypothetical protein BCU30_06810 [Vibrio lentus]